MKIAIKANPSRGKEILSLLKSLGSNTTCLSGDGRTYYYYMDKNHIVRYGDPPIDYKVYTLEEFEKEFPFKVGDTVIALADDKPYKIIALEYYNDKLCYRLDDHFHYQPRALKCYKEMKEERNITLTLDKAKEWYKKGGELKEIALQAFSEIELNPLPRSWEELCKRSNPIASWRYNIPIKYEALYKLEKLRDCWWNDWKPEWNFGAKYAIKNSEDELCIILTYNIAEFLAFPTKEMAEEFSECFKDLIEQAGDLI